jgi:UDP-N-acetylmuramate dehydrogenase
MIAHEHANWIVNQGTASASDVKKLIEKVQFDVFNRFGIQLEREVIYVPEDIL